VSSRGVLSFFKFTVGGGWLNWLGTWRGHIHSHHHVERWTLNISGGENLKGGGVLAKMC
jgi:hypothetical protein